MKKNAGQVRQIAISSIRVAERIRKENGSLDELAQDIQKHGLLNPITVMEQADGGYVLIAGLRRMKAAEYLGDTQIPAQQAYFPTELCAGNAALITAARSGTAQMPIVRGSGAATGSTRRKVLRVLRHIFGRQSCKMLF